MQPKVSVVVPIYNVEKFLEQCIESLLAQTLPELEILLVNDGSTDTSPDIIKRYAERDERIVVVDKKNGGYGQAMNFGIDRATGEYIGIVEPDDYVDAGMFADLYAAAVSYDPHAQIVRSAYWRVMRDRGKGEFCYPSPHLHRVKVAHQPFRITDPGAAELLYYHPSIWTGIYERQFLLDNHIRFKEIPGAGWSDNPFFVQTLVAADRIAYVDKCYYRYREDLPGSSSSLKEWNIPIDRWNDIQDCLDAAHVTEPHVLEAQACRGFAYIRGAQLSKNAEYFPNEVQAGVEGIYRRMDKNAVINTPRVTKTAKRKYLAVIDPDYRGKLASGYYRRLPSEFFHTLKTAGWRVTAYRVRTFFS